MEIRVNKSVLLAEVSAAVEISTSKTSIPTLAMVLLAQDGDQLWIKSTDLDRSFSSRVEVEVLDSRSSPAFTTSAKKLAEVIRASPGDELTLKRSEQRGLVISSQGSEFTLHCGAPEEFPTMPEPTAGGEIELPLPVVTDMVRKVFFAISAEESRFNMQGALFKISGGKLTLAATDGHRLSLVENRIDSLDESTEEYVIVRRSMLQVILRMRGDKVLFQRSQAMTFFTVGTRVISCRVMEGAFPDAERVIATGHGKDEKTSSVTISVEGLGAVLRRVLVMNSTRAPGAARWRFRSASVEVDTCNPDAGTACESLAAERVGDGDVELGLNASYVLDVMGVCDTDDAIMTFVDSARMVKIEPSKGMDDRFINIIMPIRL